MSERQFRTVTVINAEKYDGNFPFRYNGTLVDAIGWMQMKLSQIPAEYQSTAVFDVDSTSGYEGSHYATIKISYDRPETDGEMNARIAQAAEREARELEAARIAYERLKNKVKP